MKTIYLIKDERPFWEEISEYLRTVNAKTYSFDSSSFSQKLPIKNQDLIIGSVRIYKKLLAISQNIPRLIITDGTISESTSNDIHFLKWPTSKEAFLEITSRLIAVSLRRNFKTIVSIILKDDNETSMGQSLDFSMSGLSFKSERTFDVADILRINLFIPNFSERVSFDVEIMRSYFDPEDAAIHYGVKFLNVDEKMKEVLENFIRKIK